MPGRIATQFTVDSSSSVGNCVYPLIAIGGAPEPTSVVVNGQPYLMVAGNYTCTPAASSSVGIIPPCFPLPRTVTAVTNTTVQIDGKYPVIEGDSVNNNRPLTSNYLSDKIVIGTQITT